ncbi:MAG: aspartyl protease family protein [Bacteroidia bacterium]
MHSSLLLSAQGRFEFINNFDNRVTIPIEVHNNLILIDVSINGSFPFKFILDTGVRTTLLTEPVLLGFFSMEKTTAIRVLGLGGGEVIYAQRASGLTLRVGDVIGHNLEMIILPEDAASYSGMFGRPIAGIIGHDFFKDFVVEINYGQKYLRLFKPEDYKPRKKDKVFAITLMNNKPYILASARAQDGSEVFTQWLIDTGASQALSIYHGEIPIPDNTLEAFIGRGLSGDMFGKIGRIQRFELGDYVFEDVIAGYPDSSSIRWVMRGDSTYANLGAEILSRFKVTVDYTNRKLYLRKNSNYRKPFLYNTSGLEAIAREPDYKRFEIVYVRPGSPAQKAGVQIGDLLLSVNGVETDKLDLGEVHILINREPGKKVRLRLLRKREHIKKVFRIEGEI